MANFILVLNDSYRTGENSEPEMKMLKLKESVPRAYEQQVNSSRKKSNARCITTIMMH